MPVTVQGTVHVMTKGRLMTCPGQVALLVHPPIPTPRIENPTIADARGLAAKIEAVVRSGLH